MSTQKMAAKKVLVVDIDGVLHRGSLPAKWHERVVESLGLQDEAYIAYRETRKRYRQGMSSSQEHTARFVDSWMKIITGMSYSHAIRIAEKLIQDEGFDNFIFPSNLVRLAVRNQFAVIALSRCPAFILEIYSKMFHFDHILGAEWAVSDGGFTGIVSNPGIFDDKKNQLMECFQRQTHQIDFENSIGIGDAQKDAEWMDLFGHRIAFNPDALLLDHARSNPSSYLVVHEHKDIVICPQREDVTSPQALAQYCMDGCGHSRRG